MLKIMVDVGGVIGILLLCSRAFAAPYVWYVSIGNLTATNPMEACEIYHRNYHAPGILAYKEGTARISFVSPSHYICGSGEFYKVEDGSFFYRLGASNTNILREGSSCGFGRELSPVTGECIPQKGSAPYACSASNGPTAMQGNPIDSGSGNKFQVEVDYLEAGSQFYRYYNSLDGYWAHSFSAHLNIESWRYRLVLTDGKEVHFRRSGDIAISATSELGRLVSSSDKWVYLSPSNEELIFDQSGYLIGIIRRGQRLSISRANGLTVVESDLGGSLTFSEDVNHQPLTLSAPGVQITYNYDSINRLVSVDRIQNGEASLREYHYEDPRDPKLLTGITDERGVRYATWRYDDQGRAVSSEHADGADRVTVTYNSDGTVSVTNELGKVAKYSFQTIRGVRRITAIEGEPSPNCPSSNSTFTYDDRGLLKTKTDNKGILTTYDYNERGLEISRTEASGTPQARTVTTTWHPDWFLPVKITEPDRITQYTYDNQGRQTSQSVTQR